MLAHGAGMAMDAKFVDLAHLLLLPLPASSPEQEDDTADKGRNDGNAAYDTADDGPCVRALLLLFLRWKIGRPEDDGLGDDRDTIRAGGGDDILGCGGFDLVFARSGTHSGLLSSRCVRLGQI